MSKLSIVITHYNEPYEVIEKLFTSISHQRMVPWDEVDIHVVEDGTTDVPEQLLAELPCAVFHHHPEHGGISVARNYGFDNSEGEYVMFCDCDDMFLNALGIHLILTAANELDKPDIINSAFIEETKGDAGELRIVRHDNDRTFVHGKAFRRAYLKKNFIHFDKELTVHEDGYFMQLAFVQTKKVKYIETPFYLWCWRDDSICRKEEFVLKTYPELVKVRTALAERLKDRNLMEEYRASVISTFVFGYYDFQKTAFNDTKYAEYIIPARKAVRKFWRKYKDVVKGATKREIADAMYVARASAYKGGLLYEGMTLTQFIRILEEGE